MKTMSQYMYENGSSQTINEWLGLGNLVKLFKRMFMPWTDEAIEFYKRTWKKNIWESINESANKLRDCKKIFDKKFGKLTVELYDCHGNKNMGEKLMDKVLEFKDKPNIADLNVEPSKKNTGYAVIIYIEDPQNGLIGLFMPGQKGKLTCLMNFIQESSEAEQITSELKNNLKSILNECLNHLK